MGAPVDGVVDPIRVPAGIARRWDALPPLGQAFAVLAAATYLAHVAAWLIAGTNELGDLAGDLVFLVSAPLASAATVALPAAIVAWRPDARTSSPVLLRGAILAAVVACLQAALLMLRVRGIVSADGDPAAYFLVSDALVLVNVAAWFLVGIGLLELVGPAIGGGAVAALGAVLLYAAPWFVFYAASILAAAFGPSQPTLDGADTSGPVGAALQVLWLVAFAVVLWATVTAAFDARVDRRARALAGLAAAGMAIGSLLTFLPWYLQTESSTFALPVGVWATTAFVAAFGLGLVDPRAADAAHVDPQGFER